MVHPNYALGFLEQNLGSNTPNQIVVMSHYGPKSQDRLANDELENSCKVLEDKRT